MSKIKTYKGLISHNEEQRIRLSTNNGLTGYKITKFEMMPIAPGAQSNESVVKIFSISQTRIGEPITGEIDFTNDTLLASGFLAESGDARFHVNPVVVFDNKVINQDIFVTYFDTDGNNGSVNYYLEMEQVMLSPSEATLATLSDVRANSILF